MASALRSWRQEDDQFEVYIQILSQKWTSKWKLCNSLVWLKHHLLFITRGTSLLAWSPPSLPVLPTFPGECSKLPTHQMLLKPIPVWKEIFSSQAWASPFLQGSSLLSSLNSWISCSVAPPSFLSPLHVIWGASYGGLWIETIDLSCSNNLVWFISIHDSIDYLFLYPLSIPPSLFLSPKDKPL